MAKKQKLELTWIGKDDEVRLEPRVLIEDPELSYGDKDTENMIVHGDNLLTLRAFEQDGKVEKCLRQAHNQFNILWDRERKQYEPDFIVETEDTIYMVETKAERDIETDEVQEKKLAALKYCEYASKYAQENNGKFGNI